MKYLKKFENHAEYEEARQNLILPNVSLCAQENEVHYNPLLPYQGFCKLTLNDSSTVELEGSGELTKAMVSDQYKKTLVSAEIGESCTSIGDGAFYGCEGLTSVTIGDGVTNIGSSAFAGCSSLASVTIPDSVTSIGDYAFYNSSVLTSVTSLATTAPTIQSNTFRDVKTNGTLTVPSDSSGYDVWMGTGNYYLGKYSWTKVEQE